MNETNVEGNTENEILQTESIFVSKFIKKYADLLYNRSTVDIRQTKATPWKCLIFE